MATDFGSRLARYLNNLDFDVALPDGIQVLKPYETPEVRRVVQEFCRKYYSGVRPRLGIWGINPGRFGAGITGLPFTDPPALNSLLGIASTLEGRRELSAEFIGMVIEEYGGPFRFYADVYLGALSAFGFVSNGKNINFYDDANLSSDIVPFVRKTVQTITGFGLYGGYGLFLGSGALQRFVQRNLGDVFGGMQTDALDHPRYIMQYKRKQIGEYVKRYVNAIAVYSQFVSRPT